MDSVTLKRGNSTIQLTKSPVSIGLKVSRGARLSEIIPEVNENLNWITAINDLGGFRIININRSEQDIDGSLDALREHEMVNIGTHVYYTPESKVPFVPTGKITIRFQFGVSQIRKQELLSAYKLQILETRIKENQDGEVLETLITAVTLMSVNPLKIAYELQAMGEIKLAEPDLATPGKIADFTLPNDSMIDEQWHLNNTGKHSGSDLGLKAGADARVVKAWEVIQSLGNQECVVAIIDDGFDLGHPDLSGDNKIVAPWDFQSKSPDASPRRITPFDGDYHGTACAGLAVGISNNKGVLGVAPACRLMPVRWSSTISDDSIEAWFSYVQINGAWVVNCSWGAKAKNNVLSTRQNEAIEECATKGRNGLGCVIVFAAGNSNLNINDSVQNSVNGFAIHPDVIAVAACNSLDERSDYSNYGKEILVCGPSDGQGGRGLLTTDVRGTFMFQGIEYKSGYDAGDYTKTFGGTSGAAPIVAGVCALMLSHKPTLHSKDIREILKMSCRRIGAGSSYVNNHSMHYGFGCIDAEEAINYINQYY